MGREREREPPKRCARGERERGRKKEKGSNSQLIPMHARVNTVINGYKKKLVLWQIAY